MPLPQVDSSRRRQERSHRSQPPGPPKDTDAARLPSAPRERRPILAALAVLLIVGGALLAGMLAMRMDHRAEMLAAASTIEAGQVITEEDLVSARVAADVPNLIPADRAGEVIGRTARVEIAEGQLLDSSQVASEPVPGQDKQVVGVSLEAGRFPAGGLDAGDLVTVVDVNGQTALVSEAQVLEAVPASGTDGDWSSGAVVSLIISPQDAAPLASAAAAGSIAVVVTAVDQPIGDS